MPPSVAEVAEKNSLIVALLLAQFANLALDTSPRIRSHHVRNTSEFHAAGVTAPPTLITGDHKLRLALFVLGIIPLTEPTFLFSPGLSSPLL